MGYEIIKISDNAVSPDTAENTIVYSGGNVSANTLSVNFSEK